MQNVRMGPAGEVSPRLSDVAQFYRRLAEANEAWKAFKAKWARKRTPRYIAKGGVRK